MACKQFGDRLICSRPDPTDPGVAWWDMRGDTVWQVSLGSALTDWLTVLVAALAVVLAYRASKRSNQLQSELIEGERQRDIRDAAFASDVAAAQARAAQADRVAVWLELDPDTSMWQIVVHNGSELPVYEARATLLRPTGVAPLPSELLTAPTTVGFGLVPPGRKTNAFPMKLATGSTQVWVQSDYGMRTIRNIPVTASLFKVELEFRDTADRRWRRDGRGMLTPRP